MGTREIICANASTGAGLCRQVRGLAARGHSTAEPIRGAGSSCESMFPETSWRMHLAEHLHSFLLLPVSGGSSSRVRAYWRCFLLGESWTAPEDTARKTCEPADHAFVQHTPNRNAKWQNTDHVSCSNRHAYLALEEEAVCELITN